MTVFFQSHQITIRRLRPFGSVKQNFSATFTAYPADIQPSGADRTEQGFGRIGSVYEAYVDVLNPVKEGDQIVSNGVTYSVRAVEKFHSAGLLDHKHLIIVSQNSA